MPEICRFYGIAITMYYRDHQPPHFHARYGGREVVVTIRDCSVLAGAIAPRALGMVVEWAAQRRDALMADWDRARAGVPLADVEPLP
jgi:hypothetical protein